MDEGAGQTELLFHPAGKIAGQAATKRLQTAESQQTRGARRHFRRGHTLQVRMKGEVFGDGEVGVEGEPLAQVADAFLHAARTPDDVAPGHLDGPRRGRQNAGEHPHRRRLARTVGADEAEDLPRADFEIEARDRRHRPEGAAQPARPDGGHGGLSGPSPARDCRPPARGRRPACPSSAHRSDSARRPSPDRRAERAPWASGRTSA